MSDTKPYWFHLTVPHSGTRFINDTFTRSGYPANSCLPKEKREQRGVRLGWNHYMGMKDPDHRAKILAALDDAEVKWTTVRDPIMTFRTHWASLEEEPDLFNRQHRSTNMADRMLAAYGYQQQYFDKVDCRAYRVDRDDLSVLEDWTGARLCRDSDRHSHHGKTKMAQAIEAQDINLIEQLTAGTDYWYRFKTQITPLIRDFYSDLGYDIWWER